MRRRIASGAGGCKWVWRCPGESAPACRRQELARMMLLWLIGHWGRESRVCCGHSRQAGMDCLNHWIPACAGMTTEVSCPLPLSCPPPLPFPPHRHSGEGRNPGRRAGVLGGLRWLVLRGYIISGHSRLAGMACIKHWIPAFAGMTAGGFLGGSFQTPLALPPTSL